MLLGQSDSGGAVGAARDGPRSSRRASAAGAVFSYVTDDLAEGRMLLQARRAVLTALEVSAPG